MQSNSFYKLTPPHSFHNYTFISYSYFLAHAGLVDEVREPETAE